MRTHIPGDNGIPDYRSANGYLLLRREEPLLGLFRRGFSELQFYSSETQDWLRCQRLLNRLLSKIVNGDKSFSVLSPSDWFYRFVWAEPRFWRETVRFDILGPYTKRLHKYFCKQSTTAHSLYASLKEAELFLLEPPQEIATETRHYRIDSLLPFTSHPIVKKIHRTLESLETGISVYVHGSMATGDYTDFSDVDDLVIIHCSSWASYEQFQKVTRLLEKIARLFQCVDPLQHHGHWVFSDFDMTCLDQGTIPLVVLNKAIVAVGRPALEVKVRTSTWGFARVMWAIVQDVRRCVLSMIRGHLNIYGLKNLISSISLLPALSFQMRGSMLDKKTAIARSDEILSQEACAAVRWTTRVRETTISGHRWVQTMRYLNHVLPFRRGTLEKIARIWLPSLRPDQIPYLSGQLISSIFGLTDECTHYLSDILAKQNSNGRISGC